MVVHALASRHDAAMAVDRAGDDGKRLATMSGDKGINRSAAVAKRCALPSKEVR